MNKRSTHARTRLDTWRERGAHRFDPLQFHLMDALERRAANYQGEARQRLDERLSTLLDAYEVDLEHGPRRDQDITGAGDDAARARGALGALVDHVAAGDEAPDAPSFAAPELLKEFRTLWSRLRADSQMRQSLQQVPTNAGPLNSSALVHRAVTLMRGISPGYLQHFLSYVDDLAGLEQINVAAPQVHPDIQSVASTRKRASRKKAGKQQD
ncbi:DUF2894 domain-containing protein [Dyella mobilis]|uniref:DUF2894 domain-containing protein n=1 Tax=Dyella mobilis TaxID=1849582 RepID=A0ABS2KCW7_9GAMM|nr:DUF2894 domain-containing protein [Dyella mobilis]MBM7129021.1 DUF2894 domain-containing protein [Dyella mobilis]GLQ99285.1 hypothetical protein GCM10007863_37050 [Dyella mobilis]